jgi:hypothetical protein
LFEFGCYDNEIFHIVQCIIQDNDRGERGDSRLGGHTLDEIMRNIGAREQQRLVTMSKLITWIEREKAINKRYRDTIASMHDEG